MKTHRKVLILGVLALVVGGVAAGILRSPVETQRHRPLARAPIEERRTEVEADP